ncbi:MAG: hypothetical protein DME10_26990, partial [Candidatus Rokuibacteriota bacterium]
MARGQREVSRLEGDGEDLGRDYLDHRARPRDRCPGLRPGGLSSFRARSRDRVGAPVGGLPRQARRRHDHGAYRRDGDGALQRWGDRGRPAGVDRRARERVHHSPRRLDRDEWPRDPALPGGRRRRLRRRAAREGRGLGLCRRA